MKNFLTSEENFSVTSEENENFFKEIESCFESTSFYSTDSQIFKKNSPFFSLFPLFYWQLWPHHSEFFWPRETERSYFASDERRSILHSIFWLKKSKSLQLQSLKIQVVSAFKSLQIWAFFLKKEIIKSSSKNNQNPKKKSIVESKMKQNTAAK